MMRVKRPVLAPVLALLLLLISLPTSVYAFEDDRPGELAMIGDALIARPLLLASTAVGLTLFTFSLPVTALGGNIPEAGEALVKSPARATFLRCLGCTPVQHEQYQEEKNR